MLAMEYELAAPAVNSAEDCFALLLSLHNPSSEVSARAFGVRLAMAFVG